MVYLDVYESDRLERLLAQNLRVVRMPLNEQGKADIWWMAGDGQTYQWENKSVAEVLGDMDHVEAQLQKQYYNADHCGLIIRDAAIPLDGATLHMAHQRTKKDWFISKRVFKPAYSRYRSWLVGIDGAGVKVVEVGNLTAVARHIVAEYTWSNSPEHESLRHYHRTKIVIEKRDPHVLALMGLSLAYGLNIGETRATTLIGKFGTLAGVLRASAEELMSVNGIGADTASRLRGVL